MNWLSQQKRNITDYLIDHPRFRLGFKWTRMVILEILSAFIFAYGFRAFVRPTSVSASHWTGHEVIEPTSLISGGAGGLSQVIVSFLLIFMDIDNGIQTILISALYFVINIPLFFLAFNKISKQFAIFSFINVGFVSLFQSIIPDSWIYNVVNLYEDEIARTIFGGICTGISSGLAMYIGTSAGGADIITMYLSEKKSTSAGKYSLTINSVVVLAYVIVSIIGHSVNNVRNPQDNNVVITMALYTIIYFFVSSRIVDLINTKHKKEEIQIFTTDATLPKILIRAFPHSCTVVESKGAFSGGKNFIIFMVISKFEQKKASRLIAEYSPNAFVTVTELKFIIGKFYTKNIDE